MMIDREKVADAVEPLIDRRPMIDAPQSRIRRIVAEGVADAAIAAVLEQLREPGDAMIRAATDLWWLDFDGDEELRVTVSENQVREIWRDMLGAFLQPPDSSNPAE